MTPLRRRMLEDMHIRHLASSTQRAYVEHVGRFARHFGRSPALLARCASGSRDGWGQPVVSRNRLLTARVHAPMATLSCDC
jgi:hypothetical protein